ncbi:hypothetical protein GCM10011428_60750 [Streptomyces violaceus]
MTDGNSVRVVAAGDHFVLPSLITRAVEHEVERAQVKELELGWPLEPFGPVAEVQEASDAEDEMIEASTARQGLVAPVSGSLGTPYRKAGSSWSKGYHTGVDFPVPTGTSIRSVAAGSVVSAGWGGSFGYQVVVRHGDGRYSQYAHLSAISVRDGQTVTAGQRIGRSGSTGNSSGPHLHFEVRTGPGFGTDVDPVAYLRAGGVTI